MRVLVHTTSQAGMKAGGIAPMVVLTRCFDLVRRSDRLRRAALRAVRCLMAADSSGSRTSRDSRSNPRGVANRRRVSLRPSTNSHSVRISDSLVVMPAIVVVWTTRSSRRADRSPGGERCRSRTARLGRRQSAADPVIHPIERPVFSTARFVQRFGVVPFRAIRSGRFIPSVDVKERETSQLR